MGEAFIIFHFCQFHVRTVFQKPGNSLFVFCRRECACRVKHQSAGTEHIGCDDRQIRHSVMAQQAVFFLFPLAVGLAHSFVALKVIIEMVSIFGDMSIGGTVGLTCAIFLAAYGGYFLVTYLMSTGMVRAAIATRYSE